MKDKSPVAIVIPTWNRRRDLLRCLTTVEQLDYSHTEVIVVDNGSTDGTADAVREQFPRIEVIELPENMGAVGASNIGFRRAIELNAHYILRLDSDTILASDYLSKLVAAASTKPEAGLFVGKIFYLDDPERIWSMGARFRGFIRGTVEIGRGEEDGPQYREPFEVDLAWSTGFLLTRSALDRAKGFDPDFFVYFEEVDLCLRLRHAGQEIWCVPEARMWHQLAELKPSPWIAYQWARGKMLLFRKHSRGLKKLTLFAYAYLYAFLRAIWPQAGKGNRGPLIDALRGLNAGLRHPLTNPES